jgi:hypothetical protein
MKDEIRIEFWNAATDKHSLGAGDHKTISSRNSNGIGNGNGNGNDGDISDSFGTESLDIAPIPTPTSTSFVPSGIMADPTMPEASFSTTTTIMPLNDIADSKLASVTIIAEKTEQEAATAKAKATANTTTTTLEIQEQEKEQEQAQPKKIYKQFSKYTNTITNGGYLGCVSFKSHSLLKFLHSSPGVPRTNINYKRKNDGTTHVEPYTSSEIERGTLNKDGSFGDPYCNYSEVYKCVPDPTLTEDEQEELGM